MAAFYERAYTERDKTESGSFAQEYLNHFLEGEPAPGIEYEYRLVQQLLPGITDGGGDGARQDAARRRQPRHPGDVAAEGRHPGADSDDELKTALAAAEAAAVTPWNDTTTTRELIERKPDPAADRRRRARSTRSASRS